MATPQIRLATDADVSSLAGLRAEWESEKRPVETEGFESEFRSWFSIESPRRLFWIASADGVDVGMVNLMLFDRMPSPGSPSGGWGYLGNMYVSRRCRNRGIGRLLAGALLAEADSLGLERVVLNPTKRAIPFYVRNGFRGAHELLLRTHSSSRADTEVMTSG